MGFGTSVGMRMLHGFQAGELQRLFTVSLLRAGDQSARLLTDVSIFVCCGTLPHSFTLSLPAYPNCLTAPSSKVGKIVWLDVLVAVNTEFNSSQQR